MPIDSDPPPPTRPSNAPDAEGSRVRWNPMMDNHPIIVSMRRQEARRVMVERTLTVVMAAIALLVIWLTVKACGQ